MNQLMVSMHQPQARLLAQSVLQHAGTAALRAEATTIAARAAHALGQMQEAFQCYQQVLPAAA